MRTTFIGRSEVSDKKNVLDATNFWFISKTIARNTLKSECVGHQEAIFEFFV